MLSSEKRCGGFGNATVNDQELPQETTKEGSTGKGSIVLDGDKIAVASWDFKCVGESLTEPMGQSLLLSVESVDGQPVDLEFTVVFQQDVPSILIDLPPLSKPNEEDGSMGSEEYSIEEEMAQLELMKATAQELEYQICQKEREIAIYFSEQLIENYGDCDSLKCFLKSAYQKVRATTCKIYSIIFAKIKDHGYETEIHDSGGFLNPPHRKEPPHWKNPPLHHPHRGHNHTYPPHGSHSHPHLPHWCKPPHHLPPGRRPPSNEYTPKPPHHVLTDSELDPLFPIDDDPAAGSNGLPFMQPRFSIWEKVRKGLAFLAAGALTSIFIIILHRRSLSSSRRQARWARREERHRRWAFRFAADRQTWKSRHARHISTTDAEKELDCEEERELLAAEAEGHNGDVMASEISQLRNATAIVEQILAAEEGRISTDSRPNLPSYKSDLGAGEQLLAYEDSNSSELTPGFP